MSPPFYAMARGWLNHPFLKPKGEFSRAEAWCWLIEEAAWKPTKTLVAGKVVILERGQLCHSLRFLGESWGWQHDRCRRFVAALSHHEMIATDSDTGQLRITICNYDKYQAPARARATPSATAVRQHRDSTATDSNKETTPTVSKETSGERGATSAPGSLSGIFKIPEEWIAEARQQRAEAGLDEVNLAAEALKFLNQLADKTGPPSRAAWLNWALNARVSPAARPNGKYDAGHEPPVQRDRPTGPPPRALRDAH